MNTFCKTVLLIARATGVAGRDRGRAAVQDSAALRCPSYALTALPSDGDRDALCGTLASEDLLHVGTAMSAVHKLMSLLYENG